MRILAFIEEKFWLFLVLGIVLGFIFPGSAEIFGDKLMQLMMVILFITFLRIDMSDLLKQTRRPWLLLYITLVQLVIFPALFFVLTIPLDLDLRIALVMLAAMPAGTSAAALTEIVKGRTTLAMVITVLTSLVVPLTVPLLFYAFFSTWIEIDYLELCTQLVFFILIPVVMARLARRFARGLVERAEPYCGAFMVILIMLIIMVIIGQEADYILGHLAEIACIVPILFGAFFIFQLGGYGMVFWLEQDEKIAVSMAKTANNNVLAMVLAASFFSPKVALILILTEIPWDIMPVFYKFYRRYLN